MNSPWKELGLPGPSDTAAIKHAYAQRLKEVHPEEDPAGFQALHRAYQMGRRMATDRVRPAGPWEQPPEEPEDLEPTEEVEQNAFDFSALEEEPAEEREPEEPKQEEWDFDELLEDAPEPSEPEPSEDWPQGNREFATVYGYHQRKRSKVPAVILIGLFLLLMVGPTMLKSHLESLFREDYAETILHQLEEDWGVEVVSSPQNDEREELRYLYWLKDDPDVRFQAIYRGGRDLEAGNLGYDTNYPDVRLFHDLRSFAVDWPEYPLTFNQEQTDTTGEGADGGSPPGLFVFQMPMEGGEDFVRALGDRLQALSQESWYQKQTPEFALYLVYRDSIIVSYDTTMTEPIYTGESMVEAYQSQHSLALLHSILYYDGQIRQDFDQPEYAEPVRGGEATIAGVEYWCMVCWDRTETGMSMDYYLRKDYGALYCLPSLSLQSISDLVPTEELTLENGNQLQIYRLPE